MSESTVKPFHLKQPDGDEVERSIEFLDKVLSEFEDPDSLPHIEQQEPDTPTQGNQSEDDGYMSMNGKKELKLMDIEGDNNFKNKKSIIDFKLRNEMVSSVVSTSDTDSIATTATQPIQTTLPKVRPITPSKYASLPGSTQSKTESDMNYRCSGSDLLLNNGRTKLGIDISTVRDAVLRGVAPLPEMPPIVNEHPVTIYPGRSSPPVKSKSSSSASRKVVRSAHDLTDKKLKLRLNDGDDDGSSDCDEAVTQADSASEDFKPLQQTVSLSNFEKKRHSLITSDDDFSDDSLENAPQRDALTQIIEIKFETKLKDDLTSPSSSLSPPPPPPPLSQEPSQLSEPQLPATKCGPGIAWEIKLDDNIEVDRRNFKLPVTTAIPVNFADYENSVASTPCNSILSTDHSCSSDWPDPPENPICSTEDEAGSIQFDVTDSEDVIPVQPKVVPNGTYVIRKGRDRKHVFDIPEFMPPSPPSNDAKANDDAAAAVAAVAEIESVLESSQELLLSIEEPNDDIPQPPINIPKYRHSIDLALPSMQSSIHSTKHSEYNSFWAKPNDAQLKHANSLTPSKQDYAKENKSGSSNKIDVGDDLNAPLMRVASLPIINAPPAPVANPGVDLVSTPRRDLAPPIEEDEEPESESQGEGAPLRQIENNISALLRGDIPIARVSDIQPPRRPLGFRAGVHKSESAKEMLLSQHMFGALPPSPPESSADEIDGFPPLPPLPTESNADIYEAKIREIRPDSYRSTSLGKKYESRYRDSIESAPPVPPHRCPSADNTLKTMSMDSKCYKTSNNVFMSPHNTHTSRSTHSTHSHDRMALSNSRKRMPGAYIKHTTPSPHEERRLQTSCSLPETPIFARGCDVPRTPHRRTQEMPSCGGGSRTAPRPMNSLNSSIVGIAGSTLNGRQPQRNINHALLSSEMLRIAGGPARGWRQRQNRPVSNENLDRIHCGSGGGGGVGGGRMWDASASSRKPCTLPPNLSPNFFKKSPTDALRRVTSLLIRKGEKGKDTPDRKDRNAHISSAHRSFDTDPMDYNHTPTPHKKKGFFKNFWKKTKHYSIEQ